VPSQIACGDAVVDQPLQEGLIGARTRASAQRPQIRYAEGSWRIRALQSQLGIIEAQMPLWNAFAQAMRDNAASTDALFTQRAHAVTSMSAVDNMHSPARSVAPKSSASRGHRATVSCFSVIIPYLNKSMDQPFVAYRPADFSTSIGVVA
jgi:hypothetical protein